MKSGLKSILTISKYATALMAIVASVSISTKAYAETPSPGDEYSNATPGAASATEIMAKDAMNVVCTTSLCTIFSVSIKKQSFTITSYAGVGNTMQNAGSNNNYYGYVPSQGGSSNNGMPSYGIQITWDHTKCTKNVDVDKTVYDSVTTYMRQLVNTTPGEDPTYPQFTPAEQTMILFYTTIMELTKGSTCN